jgi:hypothetical protein
MAFECADAAGKSGEQKNSLDLASIVRGREGAASQQRDGDQLCLNSLAADRQSEGQQISAKIAASAASHSGEDLRGDLAKQVGPAGSGVAVSRVLKEAGIDVGVQTYGGNIATQLMNLGFQRTTMESLHPGSLRPGDVVRTSGNIGIVAEDGKRLYSHHPSVNGLALSPLSTLQGRGRIEVYRAADH